MTIVGVHTPEFLWEKPFDRVVGATWRLDIRYRVVQDKDSVPWKRFGIWVSPTRLLGDCRVVGAHGKTETRSRRFLAEPAGG